MVVCMWYNVYYIKKFLFRNAPYNSCSDCDNQEGHSADISILKIFFLKLVDSYANHSLPCWICCDCQTHMALVNLVV